MSIKSIPHLTPFIHSKTGVHRAVHFFLSFAPKHRLWVPNVYVLRNLQQFLISFEECINSIISQKTFHFSYALVVPLLFFIINFFILLPSISPNATFKHVALKISRYKKLKCRRRDSTRAK